MTTPQTASVVVIGGGAVGCSIAYHLARRGVRDVVVLERETVGSGTTSKAAGGIRAQFGTEAEIRFSLEGQRVLESFKEEFGGDPGFQRIGYLAALRNDHLALRRGPLVVRYASQFPGVSKEPDAGLIAYEREDARRAVAANAVDVRRLGTPLARVLAAIVTLGVVGAVVWTGWQFSAPPAAAKPQHAIVVAKPATTNVPAAVAEPAVIATRVLRDPRPVAPPPRVVAETPNAPAPAAHAEPRAEP